jgi:hypothetical protein
MDERKLYRLIADEAAVIANKRLAPALRQDPSTKIFQGRYRIRDSKIQFTLEASSLFQDAEMPLSTPDILEKAINQSIDNHLQEMVMIRVEKIFNGYSS